MCVAILHKKLALRHNVDAASRDATRDTPSVSQTLEDVGTNCVGKFEKLKALHFNHITVISAQSTCTGSAANLYLIE